MIVRRRYMGGKKSILPSGYKQLEYIENTSTAYIDTGITNFDILNGKLEAEFLVRRTGDYAIFGNRNRDYGRSVYCFFNSCLAYKNGIIAYVPPAVEYYLEIFGSEFSAHDENGNTWYKSYPNSEWMISPNPMYIFYHPTNANNRYAIGYFKKFKMYQNGQLIWDGIPCINPNNVVGMYDTVGRQFYSSPNGTAFIAGPEV